MNSVILKAFAFRVSMASISPITSHKGMTGCTKYACKKPDLYFSRSKIITFFTAYGSVLHFTSGVMGRHLAQTRNSSRSL